MPLDTITVQAPMSVVRYTCGLAGCGATIVAAPGASLAGWIQLGYGPLNGGGVVEYFDSTAHAQQWLATQPLPVPLVTV